MSPSNKPATELDSLRQQLADLQRKIDDLEGVVDPHPSTETRAALDAVHTIVAVLSTTGIFVDVNNAALECLSLTREDLIGRHIAEVPLWDHSGLTRQSVRDAVIKAVHQKQVRMDADARLRSGQVLSLQISFTLVEAGPATYLLMSAVDISERVQARLEAEDLIRKLEDSAEELNQFAYAASHDLQEPLRTILTHTQLLCRRHASVLDPDAMQLLDEVEKASAKMRGLILDLLTFSRMVHVPVDEMSHSDATAALQWTIMNLSDTIKESNATITYDSLPPVRIDDSQLVQLFQNLIGNALKYRSEDAPAVHISAEEAGGICVFSVRDNGIGIDPQYHDRIFGVFKRLHGREYPGNGIGLAICSKLVGRWGGRMWVDSELGKGATFHFTLRSAQ